MTALQVTVLQAHAQLADAKPTADEVKPGWVALVIVLAMAIALALLMRSMIKQFRKVDFDEDAGSDTSAESGPSERSDGPDSSDAKRHETNGSAPS